MNTTPKLSTPKENYVGIKDAAKPTQSRITKHELALLLALWAESKPDCETKRKEIEEVNEAKRKEESENKQQYVFQSNAGVCVLDANEKIIMVEGSGYTHAAVSACARLPSQMLKGATVFISQFPCTMCVKVLLQANVDRIIVADNKSCEFDRGKIDEIQDANQVEREKKLKDLVMRAASVSRTGVSLQSVHNPSQRPNLLQQMENAIEDLNDPDDQEMMYRFWIMGCSIIAAYRSEDPNLQVGACLARCILDQSIIVYGVSYNGSIQKALELDFPNPEEKGKFSMHAEQNLFIYSAPHIPEECELYTTHSPCTQCTQLTKEYNIKKTYFISTYKKEHFECKKLLKPKQLFMKNSMVRSLLRGHSLNEVYDRFDVLKNMPRIDKEQVVNEGKEFFEAVETKLKDPIVDSKQKYDVFVDWYKSTDSAFNRDCVDLSISNRDESNTVEQLKSDNYKRWRLLLMGSETDERESAQPDFTASPRTAVKQTSAKKHSRSPHSSTPGSGSKRQRTPEKSEAVSSGKRQRHTISAEKSPKQNRK